MLFCWFMWEWWSGKDNLPTGISPSSVSLFHTVSLSGGKNANKPYNECTAFPTPDAHPPTGYYLPDKICRIFRKRYSLHLHGNSLYQWQNGQTKDSRHTFSARQHCPHAHSRPSSVQWHLRQSKRQHAVRSLSSYGKAPHRPNWTSVSNIGYPDKIS